MDHVAQLVRQDLLDRIGRVVGRIDGVGRSEVEDLRAVARRAADEVLQIAAAEEGHARLVGERREYQRDVTVAVHVRLDAEHGALARQDDLLEVGQELLHERGIEVGGMGGGGVAPNHRYVAHGNGLRADGFVAARGGHVEAADIALGRAGAGRRGLVRQRRRAPGIVRERAAGGQAARARRRRALRIDRVVVQRARSIELHRAQDEHELLVAIRGGEPRAGHTRAVDRELRHLARGERERGGPSASAALPAGTTGARPRTGTRARRVRAATAAHRQQRSQGRVPPRSRHSHGISCPGRARAAPRP